MEKIYFDHKDKTELLKQIIIACREALNINAIFPKPTLGIGV